MFDSEGTRDWVDEVRGSCAVHGPLDDMSGGVIDSYEGGASEYDQAPLECCRGGSGGALREPAFMLLDAEAIMNLA